MNTFSNLFAKDTTKIAAILIMLGAVMVLSIFFFNARVTTAQSCSGSPTYGKRFTLYNAGGQVSNSMPLTPDSIGPWAFCVLVEDKIDESGSGDHNINHSCRIEGSVNGYWSLHSYAGSHENAQCSAFCVRW